MSRINTNVTALISARILNQNNVKLGQTLERLSTGLKINAGKDETVVDADFTVVDDEKDKK